MKKLVALLIIMITINLNSMSQTYNNLWKKIYQEETKDHPKTQLDLLNIIIKQAKKDKSYGNLLAAELLTAKIKVRIDPTKENNETIRLEQLCTETEKKDQILSAIYNCILGKRLFYINPKDTNSYNKYYNKAITNAQLLANYKFTDYTPLIIKGKDDDIFNKDLLHVIAIETNKFKEAYEVYNKSGNRQAACFMALQQWINNENKNSKDAEQLIDKYADLPIAANIAVELYNWKKNNLEFTNEQQANYLQSSIKRWSKYNNIAIKKLQANYNELISPYIKVENKYNGGLPNTENIIKQIELKNIDKIIITITRTTLTGDTKLDPRFNYELNLIKKSLQNNTKKIISKEYKAKPWEIIQDSLLLPKLEKGLYLLEFKSSNKLVKPAYALYHVSNLCLLTEEQPNNIRRYVVVDAKTGNPVKDAKIKQTIIKDYPRTEKTEILTTNSKGEVLYNNKKNAKAWIKTFAYTNNDKYITNSNYYSGFYYRPAKEEQILCKLFTDRKIYRPGQVIHTSVIVYNQNNKTLERKILSNTKIKLKLKDSNNKIISTKEIISDDFGTAATDFILPKSNINLGTYSISTSFGESSFVDFNVEEYKRPTFEVKFDKYEKKYSDGDTITIKAIAKNYSGTPVTNAKVEYNITRSPLYFLQLNDNEKTIAKGYTTTNEKGEIKIEVPLYIPDTLKKQLKNSSSFFNYNALIFTVNAKVTSITGETHENSATLPLSLKNSLFSVNIADKLLRNEKIKILFNYLNETGKEINAKVKYAIVPYGKKPIKENKYKEVDTNTPFNLSLSFPSGHYNIYATCENDTLTKDFVLFSLNDKQPVIQTHDWFYQSSKIFPTDGSPVSIQVGATDKNQHIVYSIYSGNKIIDTGTIDQSNAITTHKFVYKKEYGEGLTLNYAWVREGEVYIHSTTIQRPQIENSLKLKWITFRDKLIPGDKEEWNLKIIYPNGKAAKAQLMATLYDKSIDAIKENTWNLKPAFLLNLPSTKWENTRFNYLYLLSENESYYYVDDDLLDLASIDKKLFNYYEVENIPLTCKSEIGIAENYYKATISRANNISNYKTITKKEIPTKLNIRKDLQETAFFYPQLTTDNEGIISIKFTLPECITTWKFMGIAHDKDLNIGSIIGKIIAQKKLMIQPNIPRFIRYNDKPVISSLLSNTTDKTINGKAFLEIINPVTDSIIYKYEENYSIDKKSSHAINFTIPSLSSIKNKTLKNTNLLVVRIKAIGTDYSDGEQQYLTVLPNKEYITTTIPITQNKPETKIINFKKIFPTNSTSKKITIEYTNNPSWLIIQALPYIGNNDKQKDNSISLVSSYYANSLAEFLLWQNPNIRNIINLWKNEKEKENSLTPTLKKNQELKDILLNETPWEIDANNDKLRRESLINYFDTNKLTQTLLKQVKNLKALQNTEGSFSWWKGMNGNFPITIQIVKTLIRLQYFTNNRNIIEQDILNLAFKYLDNKVAKIVEKIKILTGKEKKNYLSYYYDNDLYDYLYINALANRPLTKDIEYLLQFISKDNKKFTIYGKANIAIILNLYGKRELAKEYLQSLLEYTVYDEAKGRYFETKKAQSSWLDYKIPTQVAAIEAMKIILPTENNTIQEMQRWLLTSKRTQAWDTPINSINAIWAFAEKINWKNENKRPTIFKIDGKTIDELSPTAGIGYVKKSYPINIKVGKNKAANTLTIEKTSKGTSWGAIFSQYFQATNAVKYSNSGLKIKREIIKSNYTDNKYTIGDKIIVRLTITADNNYDFIQIIDKHEACLEPVKQLSGYQWREGYYVTYKDNSTNFYFDKLSKGIHIIETEYFIDRRGTYSSGISTVQSAYSPEFKGNCSSNIIEIR